MKTSAAINSNAFNEALNLVIERFEGGYSRGAGHGGLSKDPNIAAAQLRSGETMFGIDRKNFAGAVKTFEALGNAQAANAYNEFWGIMDSQNAKLKWPWLYRGGPYEPRLKKLAGIIMSAQYDYLSKRFLEPQARQLVQSSFPLAIQMIYFTWNGSGFFQKASGIVNKNVNRTPRYIFNALNTFRANHPENVIKKSAKIMDSLNLF